MQEVLSKAFLSWTEPLPSSQGPSVPAASGLTKDLRPTTGDRRSQALLQKPPPPPLCFHPICSFVVALDQEVGFWAGSPACTGPSFLPTQGTDPASSLPGRNSAVGCLERAQAQKQGRGHRGSAPCQGGHGALTSQGDNVTVSPWIPGA